MSVPLSVAAEQTAENLPCDHMWKCGCGKPSCLEMGKENCQDEDMCDLCENEACLHYYDHRNDNCDCGDNSCPYCGEEPMSSSDEEPEPSSADEESDDEDDQKMPASSAEQTEGKGCVCGLSTPCPDEEEPLPAESAPACGGHTYCSVSVRNPTTKMTKKCLPSNSINTMLWL